MAAVNYLGRHGADAMRLPILKLARVNIMLHRHTSFVAFIAFGTAEKSATGVSFGAHAAHSQLSTAVRDTFFVDLAFINVAEL